MSLRRNWARIPFFYVHLPASTLTCVRETPANRRLDRILRYLAAIALISEPAASTYKASHITPHLSTPGFVAGLKHKYSPTSSLPPLPPKTPTNTPRSASFTNKPFTVLPTVLKQKNYRNPTGSHDSAFQAALGTSGDIMDYLSTHPEEAKWTFEYMAAHKAAAPTWMDGSVPVTDFTLSDADVRAGRVMVVDVGGAAGHQMLALRAAFPELKGGLVVQDVGMMIEQVDREQAEASGLEAMVHDFYTAQPVKGAKVYYLRTVLHDWGDEQGKKILGQLREAMAEDSVVVVDEVVVPAQGASVLQMHYDIAMLAALGAMERSEKQWRELLGAAGLKIRDIWIYDKGMNSGLIVAVPV